MEKDVTAAAVMTAPRYESVYARTQIQHALQDVGIPLSISGGVYYGQCMQIMLEDLLARPIDYVLTVDFDSIFVAKHVQRLLSIIAQEDEIDAVAACQPRRGGGAIMASNYKNQEIGWTGKPIRVRTAHFGLTVIDLRKLENVPKPWFHSSPAPGGGWGEGSIDDDVSFWNAWEQAGNSLFLDPGCRLGHLEEMITVFDSGLNLVHQYPQEWENGSEDTVD